MCRTDYKVGLNFFKFTSVNKIAIITQSLAMIGLLLVVIPIAFAKDPRHKVTAHPLVIIAQISLLQSFLYFYMIFGDLKVICWVIDHSCIQTMLQWIPIKSHYTYYHSNEKNLETVT